MAKPREDFVDTDYDRPHAGLEARVAAIVADVLDVDRIGRMDNFEDFDATSLQAIRICVRIEQTLGVKIPPLSLLDHETFAGFVVGIEAQREAICG